MKKLDCLDLTDESHVRRVFASVCVLNWLFYLDLHQTVDLLRQVQVQPP